MKTPQTKAECELLLTVAGLAIQCFLHDNVFSDESCVSAMEDCEVTLLEYGLLERVSVIVKPAFFGLLPRKEEKLCFSDTRHGELMELCRTLS